MAILLIVWQMALSHCMYNQYDLVILDRMMPGMDGLSVLKSLRAAKNSLPVIFLTAVAEVDDRVEGLLAGGKMAWLRLVCPGNNLSIENILWLMPEIANELTIWKNTYMLPKIACHGRVIG